MPERSFDPGQLRAVICDLDGTLYRQGSLRRTMAMRLLAGHALRPLAGLRAMRVLGAYRRAQETLRAGLSSEPTDLAAAQIKLACEQTRSKPEFVQACVTRWMEEEPLRHLPGRIQPGLVEFLNACRAQGLRLAVLSDYPAHAKLRVLGVARLFDVVLTAQDEAVGVFKPNPRGLLAIAEHLGLRPEECLYIGDRAEVDAAAATAAGMPSLILNSNLGFSHVQELVLGARLKRAQPLLDLA